MAMRDYHEQSKHRYPHQYAPGPGYMDWENQPDPFRVYQPCPTVALASQEVDTTYENLFQPGTITPAPLDRAGIGTLLELSLAISAWKSYEGVRWALRCNPSSGNLHPIEGYLVLPDVAGELAAGVYHYDVREHRLGQRMTPPTPWNQLLPADGFFLALTAIPWRVSWKYGARSYRYGQLDAGHAAAGVRYAAAVLGWQARLVPGVADATLATLLGLHAPAAPDEPEAEEPVLLMAITRQEAAPSRPEDLASLAALARTATWYGQPNRLTPGPCRPWPLVEEALASGRKPATFSQVMSPSPLPPTRLRNTSRSAAAIMRQRRSAQHYDAVTPLPPGAIFRILDRCLPRPGVPPWDLLPWLPRVQPVLMIHRCPDLPAGLYLLARQAAALQALRHQSSPLLSWTTPPATPDHLPLFQLMAGDARSLATASSCHQEIAGDGAMAVAMLVNLSAMEGDWDYRHLHWEAGMLGQLLYLEAEAEGLRGTGIGCFFDGIIPQRLELTDPAWQDIYHFTLGGPVPDRRLISS